MTAKRCRPHDWATPAVGDDALTCRACGRVLDLVAELTPAMRAAITASRCRVLGDHDGEAFAAAMNAALDDRIERYHADRIAAPVPPSASIEARPDRRGLLKRYRRRP